MKLAFIGAVLVLLTDAYYFKWEKVIEEHNVYRCMHGLKWLKWNDQIAKKAKDWTHETNGVMRHGGSKLGSRHLGQNLYWGQPPNAVAGVKMWYDEIENTDNGLVSSFAGKTGHYTQVIWRDTKWLGCGQYRNLVACDYWPPGNFRGQFEQNVNSPVKSESSCRTEVAQTTTKFWSYAYYTDSQRRRRASRRRFAMLLAETNASVTKEDSEDSFYTQDAQDTESSDPVSLASSSNEADEPSSTRLSRGLGGSWMFAAGAAATGLAGAAWKVLKRKQDASYQLMQS